MSKAKSRVAPFSTTMLTWLFKVMAPVFHFWYDHLPASRFRARGDGLVDSHLVLGGRCLDRCPIFRDDERTVAKGRDGDAFFDLSVGSTVPSLCMNAQREEKSDKKDLQKFHDKEFVF